MKSFAVLSGDKRQKYICDYLNATHNTAYMKSTMNFDGDKYIVCSTPFCKKNTYVNCDFYSDFPINTFITLLKPGQIVFGGNIPKSCYDYAKIKFVDVLKDDNVVWNNACLTAEGLLSYIIDYTDFSINHAKALIIGFGRCGISIAGKLSAMNCSVTIYDHTDIHLIQAKALNYQACGYDLLMSKLGNFDIIINTVPCAVFYEKHYAKINKNCILFEVASHPFGFNKELAHKYNLSLITCPGIPGIKSPKTAGELIAKSIISYVERTEINGS